MARTKLDVGNDEETSRKLEEAFGGLSEEAGGTKATGAGSSSGMEVGVAHAQAFASLTTGAALDEEAKKTVKAVPELKPTDKLTTTTTRVDAQEWERAMKGYFEAFLFLSATLFLKKYHIALRFPGRRAYAAWARPPPF